MLTCCPYTHEASPNIWCVSGDRGRVSGAWQSVRTTQTINSQTTSMILESKQHEQEYWLRLEKACTRCEIQTHLLTVQPAPQATSRVGAVRASYLLEAMKRGQSVKRCAYAGLFFFSNSFCMHIQGASSASGEPLASSLKSIRVSLTN